MNVELKEKQIKELLWYLKHIPVSDIPLKLFFSFYFYRNCVASEVFACSVLIV